ncbi:carboxylesterase/lipase family protein [Amycolatopsis anabasis]|uniref:carboxylesterase/lipase family protein n=1 Tax=Amycolatopsis anabasis TaxID=1840409 RepID=UPI00131C0D6D|nr:carboxylesterase family protein [Amycolatopsis anabasis]
MRRGRFRRVLAGLAVFAATVTFATGAQAEPAGDRDAVVRTDSGPVRGTVHADHRSFRGIPFAAPPVGELRWQPPRPPSPWTEPRDATKPGDRCAQNAGPLSQASTSEDCLYLNVTTPRRGPAPPRPVMVWVHGGGFVSGAGSDLTPTRLAVDGDVVVVTVNYRLGVFGFLGHPGLGAESGTFGLADQQAALRWVRHNARAFGGDPHNVTLFGESAGGMSTCAQLTSPAAAGLFQRAIIQSGACTINWPASGFLPDVPAGTMWAPKAAVDAEGARLAEGRGCADPATALACLRRVPVRDLLADPRAASISAPAFGTRLLPEQPAEALAAGHFPRIPVALGTTRNEHRLFAAVYPNHPITEADYQRWLRDGFGDRANEVAARYPTGAHRTPGNAWADMATDRVWACTTLTGARLLDARTRVFQYEFADPRPPVIFPFPPDIDPGAYHASELVFLFEPGGFPVQLTPEQQRLSQRMIGYWSRFAATGNPNAHGSPKWRAFPSVQSLAPDDIRPVDFGAEHKCDFWAGLPQR